MFKINLKMSESCWESIEQFHTTKLDTLLAEIWSSKRGEKIGVMEAFYDSSSENSPGFSPTQLNSLSVNQSPKRKKTFAGPVIQKKPKSKPACLQLPVDNSKSNGNFTTIKPSAEALISITQNLTTGEKSYQCTICGQTSSAKGNVKRHIELKHLPKTTVLKCQLCEYTANLKFSLKSHYTGKHSLPEQAAKAMID